MTRAIKALAEVAHDYDAIVLDQWGVLHDGSAPYPGAVPCIAGLARAGHRLAVLSNSGKSAEANARRIGDIGFDMSDFAAVMTSGEALWRDIDQGNIPERRFVAVEREAGDAASWACGLDIALQPELQHAEAILLMGLPDNSRLEDWRPILSDALSRSLPVYCSNPDQASPRADGTVISPGALASAYCDMGGKVTFYGKPHRPVFDALRTALGAERLLMVGDSLEHDIAGAQAAGWDGLLIQGGLYAAAFAGADKDAVLERLVADCGCAAPDYRMECLG
ncbi:TIGR01459 family HAD-type hydrolase [Oricola sp.]|uniref:TIGR01459 family HAD-type hydrolase n=1 Tax=Oricola sp. TaxID=1979950 RepID=UPI003BA90E78